MNQCINKKNNKSKKKDNQQINQIIHINQRINKKIKQQKKSTTKKSINQQKNKSINQSNFSIYLLWKIWRIIILVLNIDLESVGSLVWLPIVEYSAGGTVLCYHLKRVVRFLLSETVHKLNDVLSKDFEVL